MWMGGRSCHSSGTFWAPGPLSGSSYSSSPFNLVTILQNRSYYPTLRMEKLKLRVMMSLSQGPLGNVTPHGRAEVQCQVCVTSMYRAGSVWVLATQKDPSFLLECRLCHRAAKAPAGAVPPPRLGPENRCARRQASSKLGGEL